MRLGDLEAEYRRVTQALQELAEILRKGEKAEEPAGKLLGEVTPNMALAVGQSQATKILIPMMRCNNLIAGIRQQSMSDLLEDVLNKIADFK